MATATAHFSAASSQRPSFWIGTPEIYFNKVIDNSRLVKVEDPRRSREMRQFGVALACLFLLVMTYAWQHFKAIEYGYQIESLKIQRDGMVEMNRELHLEDASLRNLIAIPQIQIIGGKITNAGLARKDVFALPQAISIWRPPNIGEPPCLSLISAARGIDRG